jgi:nitrite reductase/ring-hydroxylating ferredoxin subunit
MQWLKLIEDVNLLEGKVTETKPVTIVVESIRICLGKHQGIFYAVEDTCPHQDASLGKGKILVSGGVECPFHHYVFDLKTGECRVGACRKLKTFPVKVENGALYISLG